MTECTIHNRTVTKNEYKVNPLFVGNYLYERCSDNIKTGDQLLIIWKSEKYNHNKYDALPDSFTFSTIYELWEKINNTYYIVLCARIQNH